MEFYTTMEMAKIRLLHIVMHSVLMCNSRMEQSAIIRHIQILLVERSLIVAKKNPHYNSNKLIFAPPMLAAVRSSASMASCGNETVCLFASQPTFQKVHASLKGIFLTVVPPFCCACRSFDAALSHRNDTIFL